jgi:hypothetical protein
LPLEQVGRGGQTDGAGSDDDDGQIVGGGHSHGTLLDFDAYRYAVDTSMHLE